jgi:ribulose-5-phosphate 4-epimerase/fuculose-1-phosphate aldolase
MTEGYIKFRCNWDKRAISIDESLYWILEQSRKKLYDLNLIGMYPDGIGFGNISVKVDASNFVITGSATGQYPSLDISQYALVTSFDIQENTISCSGLTKASAESLTHAAIYQAIPEVNAVVHVHHLELWEKLLNHFPTTSSEIEYGTPEMANAVGILASKVQDKDQKILVMGGHREGILAFGQSLEDATNQIINIYNEYLND